MDSISIYEKLNGKPEKELDYNPAWDLTISLLEQNKKSGEQTSIIFAIVRNGKNTIAVNSNPETEIEFSDDEILNCIEYAKNYKLFVNLDEISEDDETFGDIKSFLTIGFTPSDYPIL